MCNTCSQKKSSGDNNSVPAPKTQRVSDGEIPEDDDGVNKEDTAPQKNRLVLQHSKKTR